MIPGNETLNGAASALTEMSGCSASRASNDRRVGSANAAKVRSSGASLLYLTIQLSIGRQRSLSSDAGLAELFRLNV